MTITTLDVCIILIPLALMVSVSMALSKRVSGVTGFLAADRCAGRYLISTATSELTASVTILLSSLEVFSRTGFSLRFWSSFTDAALFLMGLLGLVVYRFRQTLAMTFHQFFEERYSKGVRVLASFLHVFSGLFNFGIQPAVGARFFVYFCQLPEFVHLAGARVPTFAVVMLVFMGLSMFFALTGGQVSIMVTDCLEGVLSSIFYVIIGGFVVWSISMSQVRDVLMSGPPGQSFIDPFDISGQEDFNSWYVLLGLVYWMYLFRGSAWTQGFAAAAKSAHEGRMAQIVGTWRAYCGTAMTVLISLAAFTLLHHPDFAPQQAAVNATLATIGSEQMRTQMTMPTALGVLFVPGVRGALCCVLVFGLVASQASQLHGYGSTILQDVVIPFLKRPLSPRHHMLALRMTVGLVGVFVCVFSYLFKPLDYLVMITVLIGSIYLGGIGAVVWGGLYWRRGTTAGAWCALVIGSVLGLGFNLLTQLWPYIGPALVRAAGGPEGSALGHFLARGGEKFPINGQTLSVATAAIAAASYVVVSLLSRKPPFPLETMLNRRSLQTDAIGPAAAVAQRTWYDRLLAIDDEFSRSDKLLTRFTFAFTAGLQLFAVVILLYVLFVGHPSKEFWFGYTMVTGVWLTIAVALAVTVWFMWGVTKDLVELFRTLRAAPSLRPATISAATAPEPTEAPVPLEASSTRPRQAGEVMEPATTAPQAGQ